MPVNFSIKNVPDSLAERLRERAKRNRRSLQGELLVILEEASDSEGRRLGNLTIEELLESARQSGLESKDESTAMIREARDAR